MASVFFFYGGAPSAGGADFAHIALLAQVGKSADNEYQLVSPADLLTNITQLANGIYGIVLSHEPSCRLTALVIGNLYEANLCRRA